MRLAPGSIIQGYLEMSKTVVVRSSKVNLRRQESTAKVFKSVVVFDTKFVLWMKSLCLW